MAVKIVSLKNPFNIIREILKLKIPEFLKSDHLLRLVSLFIELNDDFLESQE